MRSTSVRPRPRPDTAPVADHRPPSSTPAPQRELGTHGLDEIRQVTIRLTRPTRDLLEDAAAIHGSLGTATLACLDHLEPQLRAMFMRSSSSFSAPPPRRLSSRRGELRPTTLRIAERHALAIADLARECGVSQSLLIEEAVGLWMRR